jgi:DNA-binding response OmpR family regulator
MRNILLVDADDHALRARGDELLLDGYEVLTARTAQHARARLADGKPDALVLGELETPAAGLALLRQLRAGEIPRADPMLPALALGADADHAAVRHYQAGADIALPSTASPLLIKGALDALAARTPGVQQRPRVLRTGGLVVDCDARVASIDGAPVKLSRLEFDLLQTLAGDPRRAFTKAELTKQVWGYDPAAAGVSRTLDSHAARLRQKLRAAGPDPLVQTVRGVGYRLTR